MTSKHHLTIYVINKHDIPHIIWPSMSSISMTSHTELSYQNTLEKFHLQYFKGILTLLDNSQM